ncbi:tetratricopeptide repeat protein [Ottowia sp.]|uniref:tetratricopeptide repeat protein n=1 Tax=Ottowia sp. TaxID=1898956 RepID=UPI003A870EDB
MHHRIGFSSHGFNSAQLATCARLCLLGLLATAGGAASVHVRAAATAQPEAAPQKMQAIERPSLQPQHIDTVPAAAPKIDPQPQSGQPQIDTPAIATPSLNARDSGADRIRRELQRLTRTAESTRTVGSTTKSAQAAWQLGLIYLHGAGVRQDLGAAQRWFEQAARFGREPWAYAGMAWCHIDGCMGPPSPDAAAQAIAQLRPRHPARADYLEWVLRARQAPLQVAKPGQTQDQALELSHRPLLEKAAAAGDVHANIELGMNAAARQQLDQAERYFRRAGAQSAAAQANLQELAARHARPNPAPANTTRPNTTTHPGAADALALARKYHRGEGVPANFAEAIRFYQLAESRGSVEAKRMLALINSRPAPGGGFNAAWMQQLAYANASTTIPTIGTGSATHMLHREPTPLYDLLPAFWRQQITLVSR